MNKRALRAAVVLLLAVFTLSGCGGSGDGTAAATDRAHRARQRR